MSVARITEIKSSSKVSFDDAIKEGLKKTAMTIEKSNPPGSGSRKCWWTKREMSLNTECCLKSLSLYK